MARTLGIRFEIVPINDAYERFMSTLAPPFRRRAAGRHRGELQSRLRGMTLMALSNKLERLVLTTGNKSEMAVGYCTLYGDMCGGLAVISDVPKTMVYELSPRGQPPHGLPFPESVFTKPPSAELAARPEGHRLPAGVRRARPDPGGYIEEMKPPGEIAGEHGLSVGTGARHRQQGGPERIQAAAGRARTEGDNQGVWHRPPFPDRPEVQ